MTIPKRNPTFAPLCSALTAAFPEASVPKSAILCNLKNPDIMKTRSEGYSQRFIFKSAGSRAEILLMMQFLVMAVVGIAALVAAASVVMDERYLLGALCALLGGGFCYIAWRLLERLSKREQLLVSPLGITVITFAAGAKAKQTFAWDQIENLCFMGTGPQATHPLASEHFDAMGFGGRQAIVNVVAAEGNIAFYSGGRMIRFGIGVPSWDAESIAHHIREKSCETVHMAGLPDEISEELWK